MGTPPLPNFAGNHPASATAIKIGLGAIVGAVGAYRLEVYRRSQDRLKEAEQRVKENLEKPIVVFVDEMLTLVSRAYWNKADGKELGTTQQLEALREKEGAVEARLKAIGRRELETQFWAIDAAFVQFRRELAEGSLGKARDLMKQVHGNAAAFFATLYGNAPKVKDRIGSV